MTRPTLPNTIPPCLAKNFLEELWQQETEKQLAAFLNRWEDRVAFYHSADSVWVRVFVDGSIMAQPETGLPIIADPTQADQVHKKLGWN